jgi:hypothetical protein
MSLFFSKRQCYGATWRHSSHEHQQLYRLENLTSHTVDVPHSNVLADTKVRRGRAKLFLRISDVKAFFTCIAPDEETSRSAAFLFRALWSGALCALRYSAVTSGPEGSSLQHFTCALFFIHHHHHSEHGQGLGLKTCSFKAQGVHGLSIFVSVFPYPAIPEVGTGRPASVGGFYPFVPGGLPISFDTVWCY